MKENTFSISEMKERFQKFGVIYTPEDIKESVDQLIGLADKKELMEDFFLALKKYQDIASLLSKANISPNFTMLLYGPPGTGKTALTMAMVKKHNLVMGLVEADRLVSPLLGDTIKNIRSVFELASEFARENGPFVLFFDEIDAVAGERANMHEVGEIKRAVITFLQVMDRVLYEGLPLAIFGATNHQNQLDSAIWRRFTYHLKFEFPNFILRKNIIESFLERISKARIGVDTRITDRMEREFKFLMGEYEKRTHVKNRDLHDNEISDIFELSLKKGFADLLYYTRGYTGSDILRATRVALLRAIQRNMLTYDDFKEAIILVGGTESHVSENLDRFNVMGKKQDEFKGSTEPNEEQQSLNSKSLDDMDIDF